MEKYRKSLEDAKTSNEILGVEGIRISDSQLNKLYGQLAILLSENEGNVLIYSICAKCEPKLMIIGDESSGISKEEETIFVI